jgi:hypothetical protein
LEQRPWAQALGAQLGVLQTMMGQLVLVLGLVLEERLGVLQTTMQQLQLALEGQLVLVQVGWLEVQTTMGQLVLVLVLVERLEVWTTMGQLALGRPKMQEVLPVREVLPVLAQQELQTKQPLPKVPTTTGQLVLVQEAEQMRVPVREA